MSGCEVIIDRGSEGELVLRCPRHGKVGTAWYPVAALVGRWLHRTGQ